MAQPFVTGPAHIFIGRTSEQEGTSKKTTATPFGPLYLGTAERSPQIIFKPGWVPIFNDISGPVVPLDTIWVGSEAFVLANLTRWNQVTLNFLETLPFYNEGSQGDWDATDVGTAMLTEEGAISVWVLFPYNNKPAYSTMPKGYRFPGAVAYGPEDMNQMGTNARRVQLIFHALPTFDGTTFTLFDNDMTKISGISTI